MYYLMRMSPPVFDNAFGHTTGHYSTLTNEAKGFPYAHDFSEQLSDRTPFLGSLLSNFSHNGPTDSVTYPGWHQA